MEKKFDVVVLGSGPGGYPAAIKAAQLKKSVALVECGDLGGTCLNRGCIPSKTLISHAETLRHMQHAEEFGITVTGIDFDFKKMSVRKDKIVADTRQGLTSLLKSNSVQVIKGYGTFQSPHQIKVVGEDNCLLTADQIIIATGSEPKNMPAFPFDGERVLSSTDLLKITELPQSIAIIGGGVIGCEFASMLRAFNVEVTILEAMPSILPLESVAISDALTKAFRREGIQMILNAAVQNITRTEEGVTVKLAGGKVVKASIALVAVGRKRNTDNIAIEQSGVLLKPDGEIPTDDRMQTNVPHIYAIGDVTGNWWLAHVASHQGLVAAKNASGKRAKMHYNAIPSVVYTVPEIATVGWTLEKALDAGYQATVGAFPFEILGKSKTSGQTEGYAQLVTDRKTGQILGAQVVGFEASSLIAEMAIAIANELTVESLTETIHAHPTIAEAWLEAAYIASETPLHLPPKKAKVNQT